MKKEEFKNDPRMKSFLDKLNSQIGRKQCRYTMSGEVAIRSCDRLYRCESCEFHQTIEDEVDRQLALKAANQKRKQVKGYDQVTTMHNPSRSDH